MEKVERMPLQYINDSYMGKVYERMYKKFFELKERIDDGLKANNMPSGLIARKNRYKHHLKRMQVMYYFFNYYERGQRFKRAF